MTPLDDVRRVLDLYTYVVDASERDLLDEVLTEDIVFAVSGTPGPERLRQRTRHQQLAEGRGEQPDRNCDVDLGRRHPRQRGRPGSIVPTNWAARPGAPVLPDDEAVHVAKDVPVAHVPLGRLGFRGEVAKVALFLASDLSSFVTGITIPVRQWCDVQDWRCARAGADGNALEASGRR